jgi:hypothetical protein
VHGGSGARRPKGGSTGRRTADRNPSRSIRMRLRLELCITAKFPVKAAVVWSSRRHRSPYFDAILSAPAQYRLAHSKLARKLRWLAERQWKAGMIMGLGRRLEAIHIDRRYARITNNNLANTSCR